MTELIRAGKEWKEKMIAFGDRIFGNDVQPGGFAALLPRVYGKDASCDNNHLIVVEDGEIQAMLLTEPTTFVCGDMKVRGIGVGTVSVSETARGKGYMQLLLSTVRDWMETEGYAFAVLGGRRQRYGYWGYEPAGIRFKAEISDANLKHALTEEMTGGLEKQLTLEPMTEGSREVELAWELYDTQPVHLEREKETFFLQLQANRHIPYVIRKEGEFAGYLTTTGRRGKVTLTEVVLKDEALYPAVLRLFGMQMAQEQYELTILSHERERIAFVEGFAEGYWMIQDHQYYVADLQKLLLFSMKAKKMTCGLKDGEWKFATEKGIYCCRVAGDDVSVILDRECAAECNTDMIRKTEGEMVRLLFGPAFAVSWDSSEVPSGWLPFPLCVTEIDAV